MLSGPMREAAKRRPAVNAIATAAIEITDSGDDQSLSEKALRLACEIREHYPDDLGLELMQHASQLCLRRLNAGDVQWRGEAEQWLTAVASRTADQMRMMQKEHPEYPNVVYKHMWALFNLAKAQAGADVSEAERTLAAAEELLSRFEEAAPSHPGVIVSHADASRVRGQIALERHDYDTVLREMAAGMRLIMDHPDLNLGSSLIAAANLLAHALNRAEDDLIAIGDELRAARDIALGNVPQLLAMGEQGRAVLAALTSPKLRSLLQLSENHAAFIAGTLRRASTGMDSRSTALPPAALLALDPVNMTLAEAIERYDDLIRLGHPDAAVISLVQWLGANDNRLDLEQPARILHHFIARELADVARGTVEELDEIPGYWDFIVGITARQAGLHGIAQEYLGKAYQESRTADNPRWRDALENDYANLMVHVYSESGERDEARRWLDTLFGNNLTTGPGNGPSLADALTTFARKFGAAGIESYTADVSARLTQGGHNPARVESEEKARIFSRLSIWRLYLVMSN